MAGFKKYEKFLNKKRKQEAYIDLVESNRDDSSHIQTNKEKEINESKTSEESIKSECQKVSMKFKKLRNEKMNIPVLYLEPSGQRCGLELNENERCSLPFSSVQNLVLHAFNDSSLNTAPVRWCTILRKKFVARAVIIIVEGIGRSELQSVLEWKNSNDLDLSKSNLENDLNFKRRSESLKIDNEKLKNKIKNFENNLENQNDFDPLQNGEVENSNILKNNDNNEKNSARKKDYTKEKIIFEDAEDNSSNVVTDCNVLEELLPLTSEKFPIKLEVEAPSQYSADPIETFFKIKSMCPENSEAFPDNDKSEKNIAREKDYTKLYVENGDGNIDHETDVSEPSTKKRKHKKENEKIPKSKISRLDLLLSAQELIDQGYPLPVDRKTLSLITDIKGYEAESLSYTAKPTETEFREIVSTFNCRKDNEFVPLHDEVEPVTKDSPMFGIDCEMCLTDRGSELAEISVVNENFDVLYQSYVMPDRPIVNYLTQYSGIVPDALKDCKTKLVDVQNKLKEIIPKNGILVGHSLCFDFNVIKISHPYVIDTAVIYNLRGVRCLRPSLKVLNRLFLHEVIQSTNRRGHDPTEDAIGSLKMTFLKLQNDITFGDIVQGGKMPFDPVWQRMVESQVKFEKLTSMGKANVGSESLDLSNTSLFTCLRSINRSIYVITLEKCLGQYKNFYKHIPNQWDSTMSVTSINQLFKMAKRKEESNILVCHCKIKDSFSEPSKLSTYNELKKLDKGLNDLLETLTNNTLIVTLFTGSPDSVPLDLRSNGVLLLTMR